MKYKLKHIFSDYMKTNYLEIRFFIYFFLHRHTKIESILLSNVQTALPSTPTEVRI